MPDQRNMLDQTKMTAPIPAVGAAGEQSQNKKSNDIIPKDRKNNNSLHTLSMTELYDTTYPPKAAIIDGLLYAGTYLFVGAPKNRQILLHGAAQLSCRDGNFPLAV